MQQKLKESLLRLRKIQPSVFDEFVKDFEDYTQEVTVTVTRAGPDQILVAQGRAQQCLAIVQALRDVIALERRS